MLHQETFGIGIGSAAYVGPDLVRTGTYLDPTKSLIVEARLAVSAIEGRGGVYFEAFDGVNRHTTVFEPTGLSLHSTGGLDFVAIDVSQFHTYRMETPGGSNDLRLFIDGVFVHETSAATINLNGFGFGDGITPTGHNGDAVWDYVRIYQDDPLSAGPEPSAVAILMTGIGILGLRRRRVKK